MNYLFIRTAALFLLLSSCKKEEPQPGPAPALVGDINCSQATTRKPVYSGTTFRDTLQIPYSGGQAAAYSAGDTLYSSGSTGLSARVLSGNTGQGNGQFRLAVWGKALLPGQAIFQITFGGKTCTLSITIADSDTIPYGQPFTGVPKRQDAVIYQVNMRVFSSQGNFQGVEMRLDSIKKLGANVIYLMPIFPIGISRGINSPYCVRSYRTVNPEFGNLQQLRNLVDAAHQRGMAVMLDWVANHTAWDHEWMSSHKDWYLQDGAGNVLIPPGTNWNDVAQLNFSKNDLRLEMIRSMKYWIYQANVDGFRCDYADGPPFDFWRQALDSLRKIPGRQLLMLAEGSRNNHFVAGFDFTFGFGFFNSLKNIYGNNAAATGLNTLNFSEFSASGNRQQVVRYTSNHDVNSSDGTPLELFKSTEGSLGAFALASLMKGIPMIYGGQEVGTPYRLSFPFTGANINWNLNPGLPQQYRRIIALRKENLAARFGEPEMFSSADIVAFYKEWQGEKVMVLVNVRNSARSLTIPAEFASQSWTDAFTGNPVSLTNSYELGPYDSLILKSQ